jgi:hypothetical protein
VEWNQFNDIKTMPVFYYFHEKNLTNVNATSGELVLSWNLTERTLFGILLDFLH